MKVRSALAITGLAISACSSGTTEQPLAATVRAYSAAYLAGDAPAAHALLSERCRDRLPLDEFAPLVSVRLYAGAKLTSLVVDEQSGDLARVTYRYTVRDIDQEGEPWVRESGQWHNDDC